MTINYVKLNLVHNGFCDHGFSTKNILSMDLQKNLCLQNNNKSVSENFELQQNPFIKHNKEKTKKNNKKTNTIRNIKRFWI